MKTNEFYKLNDNFDLEEYGVILKKETILSIKEIFNDDNTEKPTILVLNANSIPGDFLIKADYFTNSLHQNIMEKSSAKYSVGDCVNTSSGKVGVVKKVIFIDFTEKYYYNVKLNGSGKEYGYKEEQLEGC